MDESRQQLDYVLILVAFLGIVVTVVEARPTRPLWCIVKPRFCAGSDALDEPGRSNAHMRALEGHGHCPHASAQYGCRFAVICEHTLIAPLVRVCSVPDPEIPPPGLRNHDGAGSCPR